MSSLSIENFSSKFFDEYYLKFYDDYEKKTYYDIGCKLDFNNAYLVGLVDDLTSNSNACKEFKINGDFLNIITFDRNEL